MKIIITTSDSYHHCLPIFFDCYNRHFGDPFELVGYKKPNVIIPDNCTFVSIGKQRGPAYFSDDMAEYFRSQDKFFVWMMEDTFIKKFDRSRYEDAISRMNESIGRFNLTREGMNRAHIKEGDTYTCMPDTIFRLSTMPSIWNREFLLQYMTPGLSPWKFEVQTTCDDFEIKGLVEGVIEHNEGVRKHDIYKLNFDGLYD